MKFPPVRRPARAAIAAAVIALAAFSCESLVKVDENEVDKVVALVRAGDAARLEKLTALPFLLDGEIIALPGDAGILWRNLKAAGVTLAGTRLVRLTPAGGDAYKLFADTWEVSVFFKKYVPPNGMIAEIRSDSGAYLLLLGGYALDGYARIIGLKILDGGAP
ncbi:MAG: hypothetical protein JXD23_16470 [Spirochaetales bacterium]|nr:hypothetical protein [Spirochaetales bacterium]